MEETTGIVAGDMHELLIAHLIAGGEEAQRVGEEGGFVALPSLRHWR